MSNTLYMHNTCLEISLTWYAPLFSLMNWKPVFSNLQDELANQHGPLNTNAVFMFQLLDSCTTQLKMPQPAKTLYTPDGEQLQAWDEIERDMIVCVCTGHPFMSRKGTFSEGYFCR